MQRTCCQRAEVLVTEGDVDRIARSTGREDFWEHRACADASYLETDPEDPDWLALTLRSDGRRRMLRREPSGDCVFLGSRGCALELETRPLVCRLYPWAYVESSIVGADEQYCPTRVLSQSGRPMVEVLGVAIEDARRWHSALYRELRDGRP